MTVSFEIENRIDHVLEHSGTGHSPLLGHVTYNEHRYSKTFCQHHENIRRFSHLGYRARGACDFLIVHGLNGVDHAHVRFLFLDDFFNIGQIGLAQKKQVV